MLILKKYIYLSWKKNYTAFNLSLIPFDITLFYFRIHLNLTLLSQHCSNKCFRKIQSNYFILYKLFFLIKTKHLFLFTIYLIYTKLLKLFVIFNFNFTILKKKIKKITILRAPCYHKNSKEQYGLDFYKGFLKSNFLKSNYKFYNLYILSFLNHKNITFITKYWYVLKKNERKYIK